MRIYSISKEENNNVKTSFTSWAREVKRSSFLGEKILHRNDTSFFRGGAFWDSFTDFIVDRFKNIPKVNVYSYGCSDGSEPFSFAMKMLSNYDENVSKKFLPIIAKDYDRTAIEKVKSREYFFLNTTEIEEINKNTKGKYSRFFKDIDSSSHYNYAFAKTELYDNCIFSVADIKSDYREIKPNNSIVFMRNFWPYIEAWQDRQKLLKKISKHLGENSFIIIGEFDRRGTGWTIDKQIIEAGFRRTPVDFVYEKVSDATKTQY